MKIDDISHILNENICICKQCQIELNPKFIPFKVHGYSALAIYEYNAMIKKLVYQFKGCYDYELHRAFIGLYAKEIGVRYIDYVIIPVPSFKKDDEERGFNHVVEIFKNLNLKMLDILEKSEKHKQATSTINQRKTVYKVLEIKRHIDLSKTKVLLVDDIYTTGSTMKSAINLVEKLNPKMISVLVMAKTKPKPHHK